MDKSIIEILDEVSDERSFLAFVEALKKDREADVRAQSTTPIDAFGRGPGGWENHTIEDFLDAALSWAEATNLGATQGLENASPWKRAAVFLYCGKIYE